MLAMLVVWKQPHVLVAELIVSIFRAEEYVKQETCRSRRLASSGFLLHSFLIPEDGIGTFLQIARMSLK
jgi:hypothetical protein